MPHDRIRRYLRHGMLPQLAVFEAAARLGSYTRAAEALHLAQPTVSTQIRKLSDTLELVLFEQIGKRVHLTPAGESLYAGCKGLFESLARIEDSLASLRDLDSGRLRLAVCTSAKNFTPRLLAEFAARHPKIAISLQIENRASLISRVAANADDLYIFAHPPEDLEVVTQTIMPNPLVVFARADHPFVGQRKVPLAALAEEPFLAREAGSGTRLAAEAAFAKQGLEPRIRMELSTNEAIKEAVLAGMGVAVLSRHTHGFETDSPQLAVLDVEGFPIERQWQFVYPVGKNISAIARAFMDFVRKEAHPLLAERRLPTARPSAAPGRLPTVTHPDAAPPP